MVAPVTVGSILIAEDDLGIRTVLVRTLRGEGYEVKPFGRADDLVEAARAGEGDLVITDVILPDGSGLDALSRITASRGSSFPVIVMSAQNTFMTAVSAAERGAYEYLPKPFDIDELTAIVSRALTTARQSATGHAPEIESMPLVGRSPAMQDVYRTLARVMQTDLTVLVTGESGTGKELVARALHDYGKRRNRSFVAVNMAAIPRDLIEAELFGHEKGAFTGADVRVAGRFEQAEGGTLFLDEIGDMPMEAQTRLLRVLQEREFTPVGGRRPRAADVRIVAATNQDLTRAIEAGRFREDLFYRLNVVPLRLPALRERAQDIRELSEHFVAKGIEVGLPVRGLSETAMEALREYHWPGNVRELENVIRRLMVLSTDEVVQRSTVDLLLRETSFADSPGPIARMTVGEAVRSYAEGELESVEDIDTINDLYSRMLERAEKALIETVLSATSGNQLRTAKILGVNRNTLRKRIRDLAVSLPKGSRIGP